MFQSTIFQKEKEQTQPRKNSEAKVFVVFSKHLFFLKEQKLFLT